MARITNLVQNPRGKYTSGTVEVRRNMASDPRQMTADGKNNLTLVTGQFGPFSTASRGIVNGPWKAFTPFDVVYVSSTETPMVVRFWLATSTGLFIQNLSSNITITDTWGGKLYRLDTGEQIANQYPIQDGVLREYALTFTVPATQTTPWRFGFKNSAGDSVDRGEITMTGFCMESGTKEIRPYFDGSYSPDPDLTPSWTGTENASASILTGQRVTSFGSTNNAKPPYQSATHGVALAPSDTSSGDSALYILGQSFGSGLRYLLPGKWYAAKTSIYIDSPITKTSNHCLSLIAQYSSVGNWTSDKILAEDSSVENISGEHTATITFQVPTDVEKPMVWVRAFNGSKIPTDVVYFNNIIVAQADTEAEALAAVQTYFDGDYEPFRISSGNQLVIPKWSGTAGSSSSYYDWTEPYTLAATWDDVGQRTYELGCDRGVFYPPDGDGVLWNGLTAVNFSTENGDSTSYYHDGVKYFMNFPVGEFKGHLEAFTYPDEFMLYDGFSSPVDGMYLDEQQRKPFGLTYRTRIGDDQYGDSSFYRIHILYNVHAVPSEKAYATISESPTASTFTWDLKTLPVAPGISGSYYSNTSHIVVDTRRFELSKIKALEEILYGDGADPGRLPLPAEVYSILNN